MSPSTVTRYLAALSHAFTIAEREWHWVEANPLTKIEKPKQPKGRERFLADDERDRLLQACTESPSPYLYAIVVLAISTGMRYSEILGLRRQQIDLQKGRIVLSDTKNNETRSVPLVGYARDVIVELLKVTHLGTTLLFPVSDKKGNAKPADIRIPWNAALSTSGQYMATPCSPCSTARLLKHLSFYASTMPESGGTSA